MQDDQLYFLRRSLLRHFHDGNVQMIDHLAFKRTGCPIDPLGKGRPGLLVQLDGTLGAVTQLGSCQPSLRNMMFLSYLITEIAPTAQNSFFRQAGMGK